MLITFSTAPAARFAQNTSDLSFHELLIGILRVFPFKITVDHRSSRKKLRSSCHVVCYTCYNFFINDNIVSPYSAHEWECGGASRGPPRPRVYHYFWYIWRQIGVIQLLPYKHNHTNSTLRTELMFIDTIVSDSFIKICY